MSVRDLIDGFSVDTKEERELLMEDFDIVFIEQYNQAYDKATKNSMFYWQLVKLYDLSNDALISFAKDSGSTLWMNQTQMNAFVSRIKGKPRVVMIEKEGHFLSINHPDYEREFYTEEDAELF